MEYYSIKHRKTKLYFGGFNADNSVKWVEKEKARLLDKLTAIAQVHTFEANDIPTQL